MRKSVAFSAGGDGGRRSPEVYPVMPIRTPEKSNKWRPLALCVAMILFIPPMISAVARIQASLCQAPPWPGDPVIVVDQAGATRSHIVAPQILPLEFRSKFWSLIGDVDSTGNSGSGVFDPNRKCLLGIMSRKFKVGGKYVAKYFVPASEIREFIPIERRDQVLVN